MAYPEDLPTVGGSLDTWGTELNLAVSNIDARLNSAEVVVAAAITDAAALGSGAALSGQSLVANGSGGADWGFASPLYGITMVVWDGSAWRCKGQTITARSQVGAAAFNDGGLVLWNTSLHPSVTSPPTMALAGDWWMHEGGITPVSS